MAESVVTDSRTNVAEASAEHFSDCLFCRDAEALSAVGQTVIYADDMWRVTGLMSAVVPMIFLSTVRHTRYLWGLSDEQAGALGPLLRWSSTALRTSADAELVLTCGFGQQVEHCHFALLAYRSGDPLVGLQGNIAAGTPPADVHTLTDVYQRIREIKQG
jgi:diadenosine tetraphosphate (Ap4A) HIT family hydrolase